MSNYNKIVMNNTGGGRNMEGSGLKDDFMTGIHRVGNMVRRRQPTEADEPQPKISIEDQFDRISNRISTVENIDTNITELGLVTGIAVKTQNLLRSVVGQIETWTADKDGDQRTNKGSIYILLTKARSEAVVTMNKNAIKLAELQGQPTANVRVIGTRVDVSEFSRGRTSGVIIVTAYGTAVIDPRAKSAPPLSLSNSIDKPKNMALAAPEDGASEEGALEDGASEEGASEEGASEEGDATAPTVEATAPTVEATAPTYGVGADGALLRRPALSGGNCGKKHSRRRLGRKPKKRSRKKQK